MTRRIKATPTCHVPALPPADILYDPERPLSPQFVITTPDIQHLRRNIISSSCFQIPLVQCNCFCIVLGFDPYPVWIAKIRRPRNYQSMLRFSPPTCPPKLYPCCHRSSLGRLGRQPNFSPFNHRQFSESQPVARYYSHSVGNICQSCSRRFLHPGHGK